MPIKNYKIPFYQVLHRLLEAVLIFVQTVYRFLENCQKICQPNGKQVEYIGKTTLHCFCNVVNDSMVELYGNILIFPGSQEVIGSIPICSTLIIKGLHPPWRCNPFYIARILPDSWWECDFLPSLVVFHIIKSRQPALQAEGRWFEPIWAHVENQPLTIYFVGGFFFGARF